MVALALPLGACSGTITFGADLTDSGQVVSPEVGPKDVAPDIGPDTGPDGGLEDRPAPDLGPDGGCYDRTAPTAFPVTWPFAPTKEAYKAKFWDGLPARETCVIDGCHAVGFEKPLIPATEAALDNADTLQQAISELWETTQETTPQGASGPVRVITWRHSETGGAVIPFFVQAHTNFLDNLVNVGQGCTLMPYYLLEADAGPTCEAGVCDCLVPTSSVAACL